MNLKEELENNNISLRLQKSFAAEDHIQIYINADENDADYVDSINTITVTELLKIIPIVKLIKDKYEESKNDYSIYNWSNRNDYLNEEQIEIFEQYMPWTEHEEVHTVEKIELSLRLENGEVYEINY